MPVPASNTSRKLDIRFPEELPVSGQRQVIKDALQAHQVVIVCGETGSGKTTQLPKICLDLVAVYPLARNYEFHLL